MEPKPVSSDSDSEAFLVSNPWYSKTLLKSLYKSWQDGEFCDITLHVGEKKIKAHKNILSSLSEYFKVLFHMDAENKSDVELYDVDFECLELLLKFAYTGSLEVTLDNVQNLFVVADYLQVEFVRNTCEKILLKKVDKTNCVSMLLIAEKFYLANIKKRCLDLIGKYLEEVSQSEEFLSIPYDTVLELFERDDLIVFRDGYPLPNDLVELAVLEASIRYISGQSEETKLNENHVYSLIVATRLIYIDYSTWEKVLVDHATILLAENLSKVRQYLVDNKDVSNKYLLLTMPSSKILPFKQWTYREGRDTKIIPGRGSESKSIWDGVPPADAGSRLFNDEIMVTEDNQGQISKISIVTRYNDSQQENVIVGLHMYDGVWHCHGLGRDSPVAGNVHEVVLEKGEVIVQVEMRTQHSMTSCIKFTTNRGRTVGHFGGTSPPDCKIVPPPNFSGHLHSFSGRETEYWGNKAIACLNVNWLCYRNIDDPDCIGNLDIRWLTLEHDVEDEDEEEDDDYYLQYTSSDDFPLYHFGEESEDEFDDDGSNNDDDI
ncbi:actin-binding protein IPP-like [Argopecten irradians]|uniref:actin-binding protein IPP-like n=1 Tax=Argopecten irradians TaxID=31199 RepID=UPI00371D7A14